MYDVIVVGARCAGASTAMLLARAGYRVLVVDRVKRGTDKLSTLYIHQPGVALLSRWGVLDDVIATGCPALPQPSYEVAGIRLTGPGPEVDGSRSAFAPRRHTLDAILSNAAAAAGADVRHQCTMLGLIRDGSRVTGVRYRDQSGTVVQEPCALVIGADGMRSTVARLVGANEYEVHPKLSCAYYSYWAGVPAKFEQYQREGHWVGVIPTNDNQILVAAYFRQHEFDRIRAGAADAYLENIRATAPTFYERLRAGEQVDHMYGTGDQQNFLRSAAGHGWALVGDSGHHKDSLTARGITDAFLQAQLIADCLGPASGGMPVELALRQFARKRDPLLMTNYQSTLAVAKLDVTPERLRLLQVVQGSPELTERYFAAAAGVLSPTEFYTGELLSYAAAS